MGGWENAFICKDGFPSLSTFLRRKELTFSINCRTRVSNITWHFLPFWSWDGCGLRPALGDSLRNYKIIRGFRKNIQFFGISHGTFLNSSDILLLLNKPSNFVDLILLVFIHMLCWSIVLLHKSWLILLYFISGLFGFELVLVKTWDGRRWLK